MEVKNFEDLEIWKDARLLTKAIYRLTQDARFAKDHALRDQIRRAAVSIMSNIAEGFERGGAAIRNSFSFFISPKPPVAKFARTFTSLWINLMSRKRIVTMRANHFAVCRS